MNKRLAIIVSISVLIFLAVIWLFTQYFQSPETDLNTNAPITYTTVTDNELLIIHLNATVTAAKLGLQLQLNSHTQTDTGVDTTITVRDAAGTELGELRFSNVAETQTIGSYRFRLVSATKSAVQVLALATTESISGE